MALYEAVDGTESDIPEKIAKENGLIGVYNGHSSDLSSRIFVADKGIWIYDKDWELIKYSDMMDLEFPAQKDASNSELGLLLEDGSRRAAVIVGGQGRVRDLYEFGRFLRRCMTDSVRLPAGSAPGSLPSEP